MNNKQKLKISHVWSASITGNLHVYREPEKTKNNFIANHNYSFKFMLKMKTTNKCSKLQNVQKCFVNIFRIPDLL